MKKTSTVTVERELSKEDILAFLSVFDIPVDSAKSVVIHHYVGEYFTGGISLGNGRLVLSYTESKKIETI